MEKLNENNSFCQFTEKNYDEYRKEYVYRVDKMYCYSFFKISISVIISEDTYKENYIDELYYEVSKDIILILLKDFLSIYKHRKSQMSEILFFDKINLENINFSTDYCKNEEIENKMSDLIYYINKNLTKLEKTNELKKSETILSDCYEDLNEVQKNKIIKFNLLY